MYGKHFASMYEGSMIGKGSVFFAVWGYVISHMKPDRNIGAHVELNPQLIAFLIGEEVGKVEGVIEDMCSPDPKSRSTDHEGRKLIRLGEYEYGVVNGAKYRAIRNEEERREYLRLKQAERRNRSKNQSIDAGKAEAAGAENIEESKMEPGRQLE